MANRLPHNSARRLPTLPRPMMPMVFAMNVVAHIGNAIDQSGTAHRLVGFGDPFRQGDQHAERVFGDRLAIATGLVEHQDSRVGASLDVDGVVTDAVRRHDQELGSPRDQRRIDVKPARKLVPRRPDLIDMGGGDDRCRLLFGGFVLEPVEPDVTPLGEHLGEDGVGEIFDVEDAFGVHGHGT
jgi:hypothetical protein